MRKGFLRHGFMGLRGFVSNDTLLESIFLILADYGLKPKG